MTRNLNTMMLRATLLITPHVLRHTFATEVVRQGGTLPTVKEILGHKYMTSTQVYTHTTNQEKRASVKGLFQKREVS